MQTHGRFVVCSAASPARAAPEAPSPRPRADACAPATTAVDADVPELVSHAREDATGGGKEQQASLAVAGAPEPKASSTGRPSSRRRVGTSAYSSAMIAALSAASSPPPAAAVRLRPSTNFSSRPRSAQRETARGEPGFGAPPGALRKFTGFTRRRARE